MYSRLFVRVGSTRRRIRAGEQERPEPAKLALCQHRTADSASRGRNCPECGLPMPYLPPASALCPR